MCLCVDNIEGKSQMTINNLVLEIWVDTNAKKKTGIERKCLPVNQ